MEYFDQEYFETMNYYCDDEMVCEFKGNVSLEQVQTYRKVLEERGLLKENEKFCDYHVTALDDVLTFVEYRGLDVKQASEVISVISGDRLMEILQFRMA